MKYPSGDSRFLFFIYIIAWTPARPPVGWCTRLFRVLWVLLQAFSKVPPIGPRFFLESTCTLPANQRWCFVIHFCVGGVKVKSRCCCFLRANFTMKIFMAMKPQEKSKNELLRHTYTLFLHKYICKYKQTHRPKPHILYGVVSQDILHSLHCCRVWYTNWDIMV